MKDLDYIIIVDELRIIATKDLLQEHILSRQQIKKFLGSHYKIPKVFQNKCLKELYINNYLIKLSRDKFKINNQYLIIKKNFQPHI